MAREIEDLINILGLEKPNRDCVDIFSWEPTMPLSSSTNSSFSVGSYYKGLSQDMLGSSVVDEVLSGLKKMWQESLPSKVSIFFGKF
ncbi:unnamed protein product [Lathyrus sativus]|nr:unnamed protein product [Lathyrus sativus]